MTQPTELVVVRKDQLEALLNAAANVLHERQEGEVESIIQDEFLARLKERTGIQSRPVVDALRHVNASGVDSDEPILLILPPDMAEEAVATVFASSVQRAASLSADGEGTEYFEALNESLLASGLAVAQDIQSLAAGPWDMSKNPAEPDLVEDDDPQWVRVRVSGSAFIDTDSEPQMELLDGTPVDFKFGEPNPFLGFVTNLTYTFPRGDRYGIPEEATHSGGRVFVVDELGYACSRNFDVMGVDSGDDTPAAFVAECVMPRDILEPVDRPGDRMRA